MNIPKDAEQVDFGAIFKTVEKPSQLVPGLTVKLTVVKCPACGRQHPDFPAHESITCECGLSIAFYNNHATIWRAPPKDTTA